MKKALFKKEFKKFYVEAIPRIANIVIDAEPENDEDCESIINAIGDIILQKSVNGDIYDAIAMEHPDLKELISKEDFIMTARTKIQEALDKTSI